MKKESIPAKLFLPLMSDKPSEYADLYLDLIPELRALIGCPQREDYHPEGDVWQHTLRVLDAAAEVRIGRIKIFYVLPFMLAALFHDIGKPETTDQDGHAYKHEVVGEEKTREILTRIGYGEYIVDETCKIVRWHMQPHNLERDGAKPRAWRRLGRKINLKIVKTFALADKQGR